MARRRNLRWLNRSRALGRIGRETRRRGIGAGRSGDPRDGDGDGFYSPKPGMPDETPVPLVPEMLESRNDRGFIGQYLDDLATHGSYPTPYSAELQTKAHESAIAREKRVVEKYGDVRKKKTARMALKKAFPNATTRAFLGGRGRSLNDNAHDMVVALLDMADEYPETAKRILVLDDETRPNPDLGGGQISLDANGKPIDFIRGEYSGDGISLNVTYDAVARINASVANPEPRSYPHAMLLGAAMKMSGSHSDRDIARVVSQGIALHEFGHALHTQYGYRWHRMIDDVNQPRNAPPSEYKEALFSHIQNFFEHQAQSPIDRSDLEDIWNEREAIIEQANPLGRGEREKRVRTIRIGMAVIAFMANQYGLSDEVGNDLRSGWASEIVATLSWDGYAIDQDQRVALRKFLGIVSGYARHGLREDPNTQYMEGVAENISAMHLGYVTESQKVRDHLIEILRAAGKIADSQVKAYELDLDAARTFMEEYEEPPETALLADSNCRGLIPTPVESTKKNTARRLKGKALGVPIGASDDEPTDGDGDGKYTAFPGGEDNVPIPPKSGGRAVEWTDIVDIVDLDAFEGRYSDRDPEDALFEIRELAVEAWGTWASCREIRQAAYELAGSVPGEQDPNIDRTGGYFGNGWETRRSEEETTEFARVLMAEIFQGVRNDYNPYAGPLYRAVDVGPKEREGFEEALKTGSIVDIPLLATADRRSQGPNEFLTKFGTQYLIVIEPGSQATEGGFFDPLYSRRDEDDTLNRIEGLVQGLQDELDAGDLDDDKESKIQREVEIKIIRRLLADYEQARERGAKEREQARDDLAEAVQDWFDGAEDGQGLNWEGQDIKEEDGSPFWDALDAAYDGTTYSEVLPKEQITGGRFEVLSVEDDPEGVYGQVIRLRQIGAFDPQNPGTVAYVKDRK